MQSKGMANIRSLTRALRIPKDRSLVFIEFRPSNGSLMYVAIPLIKLFVIVSAILLSPRCCYAEFLACNLCSAIASALHTGHPPSRLCFFVSGIETFTLLYSIGIPFLQSCIPCFLQSTVAQTFLPPGILLFSRQKSA